MFEINVKNCFKLNFLNSCYLQMCQMNFSNEMFMKSELTSLFINLTVLSLF